MAEDKPKNENSSVEDRLESLYKLQCIYSEIDRIKQVRGDLPLEVKDIDDNIAGLRTRLSNFEKDIEEHKKKIAQEKLKIQTAQEKIKELTVQLNNSTNSRVFSSKTKEIDYQGLEIELAEINIKKSNEAIETLNKSVEKTNETLIDQQQILEEKKKELEEIVSETKQEEENLRIEAKKVEPQIDERTLMAFKRIRQNARNGLGIVSIQRDACGGCYNRIPPQKQLEIKMHKKIIVCEYCGRILIDPSLTEDKETVKD